MKNNCDFISFSFPTKDSTKITEELFKFVKKQQINNIIDNFIDEFESSHVVKKNNFQCEWRLKHMEKWLSREGKDGKE